MKIDEQAYRYVYEMQPLDRAALVKQRVPAAMIAPIAADMGISKEKFAKIAGLSLATVNPKSSNKSLLSLADSEIVVGVVKLIGQVDLIVSQSGDPIGFKAPAWFRQFIEEPVNALGGIEPAYLLDTTDGREAISELLFQIQSGAYA